MTDFATVKTKDMNLDDTRRHAERDLSFLRAIDTVDELLADEAMFDALAANINDMAKFHKLLTEDEIRYVELERKLALIKQRLRPAWDAIEEYRDAVVRKSGIRVSGEPAYFADGYGVVHKIEERTHTTVEVHPYGIAHTRRPEFGETRGSLSEKEAKEHGFEPVVNKDAAK